MGGILNSGHHSVNSECRNGKPTALPGGDHDPFGRIRIVGHIDQNPENVPFPLANTVLSNGHETTLQDPTAGSQPRAYLAAAISPVRRRPVAPQDPETKS
ncbi:hypothetical protein Ate02nite_76180 [Paractinoplanes tereljensis]|uniref:Uncharacterized protein n=1 Tax=Paractinoplanes tereljensis TaxID=571912 RepID=A0A919TVJ7_9ACTN|nr:hypothetical protein Ate02nite_76180 [Actinoplanes tereljensis]